MIYRFSHTQSALHRGTKIDKQEKKFELMGLGIVSDLGVGRGEEMSLEAGLEDGEGLRVTNMY